MKKLIILLVMLCTLGLYGQVERKHYIVYPVDVTTVVNDSLGFSYSSPTVTLMSKSLLSTETFVFPFLIGGSSTTQDLTFQTTTGVGATGADMHFLVGNNGATETMTILNNGTVGIGTTAPNEKLDVNGGIGILSGVTVIGKMFNSAGVLTLQGNTVRDVALGSDSFPKSLFVEGVNGNVGIGTASPLTLTEIQGGLTTTGAILTLSSKETSTVVNDVLGRINFRAALDASGGDAILTGAGILAIAEDTFSATVNKTSLQFQTGVSEAATTKMTILSDGWVGIGTVNPYQKLEVLNGNVRIGDNANVARKLEFERNSVIIGAVSTDAAHFTFTAQNNKQLRFYDDANNGLIIDDGGNVGIGTASPDSGRVQIYGGAVHDLYLGDATTWSYADAGSGWTTSSDSTLKENIIPVTDIITPASIGKKILDTPIYRYNFKKESLGWKDVSSMPETVIEVDTVYVSDTSNAVIDTIITSQTVPNQAKLSQITSNDAAINKASKEQFGFLAQEFGAIWENNPDKKYIDWQKVAAIQWYAIQELTKKILDHESRLKVLENK
jgi:hypothetical protein